MAKQILFDKDARAALKRGVDKLAKAVSMTLGPRGRAVIIDKGYGVPDVTFDGVTVAKEIKLQDKYEDLGAQLVKQAAEKTADNVGDGTTTSVVLAQAMIEESEKVLAAKGFNVIQLAEQLRHDSEAIVKSLEKDRITIDIKDKQKVAEIATLSAKDKATGELIAEIFSEVGKDGVVTVDESQTMGLSKETVEGLQFDRGYVSPYMVTNSDRMESVMEDPYVLITDQKITAMADLLPLLEKVIQSGKKEIVIIADDIEGEALATLILNKLRGTFSALAVKAPGFGERRKEMLEDIAIVTGGKVITPDVGMKLENTDVSMLGSAHRVVATKDATTIVGGKGDKAAIDKRATQIRAQLAKTDSEFDKEKLNERLAKLSGGVAVLKVGAATESEMKEKKYRIEDAIHATRAALEEGIVPGGGIALFNNTVAQEQTANHASDIAKAAHDILMAALRAPLKSIVENSGESSEKVMLELETQKAKSKNGWLGFEVLTKKIVDLKESGVADPLKVTKTALMNAVSVTSNYLLAGVAITDIPEKKDAPKAPESGYGEEDY